jgi:hypothetical protein
MLGTFFEQLIALSFGPPTGQPHPPGQNSSVARDRNRPRKSAVKFEGMLRPADDVRFTPEKGTSTEASSMSALCQKRTSATGLIEAGPREQWGSEITP